MYSHLLHRFAGLGDALFVNTIAFHLARQESSRILVGTNHPAIFAGNDHVRILPAHSRKWGFRLARLLARLRLVTIVHYLQYVNEGARQPQGHVLAILARQVGLKKAPDRPRIFLSQDELLRHKLPRTSKPWVAIQSGGRTDWTTNKEWYPARFEAVACTLRRHFGLVQLGLASEPPLSVDQDLRGKVSPRQAAAVLASCQSFVGQVGFLMHAAAAVNVPSVIVYGGFEAPWQSGYPWNENLFTSLECSPCWQAAKCPIDRLCMQEIKATDVLAAFERVRQTAANGIIA
jgi:ADP-heptose:LPS heptosyltransferase